MIKHSFYILLASLLLFLVSCKDKKEELVIDYAYTYFPTDSGHYVIYDVDSITFSFNQVYTRDTSHYQLMEIVTDTVYDNLGELNRKLERYRRKDAASPWEFDRVWRVKQTGSNAQKVEDDMRFVKMVFPPKQGQSWNGNIYIPESDPYNDFKNWDYHYTTVHQPYSINGFSFDSTLTVSEIQDTVNLIKRKQRIEVYAKNVGLIYQEWEILHRGSPGGSILGSWDATAERGFKIKMRVAEFK